MAILIETWKCTKCDAKYEKKSIAEDCEKNHVVDLEIIYIDKFTPITIFPAEITVKSKNGETARYGLNEFK